MTPAFIKLSHKTSNNPIYIQVVHIMGFGHAYGDTDGTRGYFVRVTSSSGIGSKIADQEDATWLVNETPEEIMALIDKATLLVAQASGDT